MKGKWEIYTRIETITMYCTEFSERDEGKRVTG